jgi:hypothetical protein
MGKVQVKGLVHALVSPFTGEIQYAIHNTDMSSYGCGSVIKEITVEVDELSKADLTNGTIRSLRETQARKRAEAEMECNNIEERIQRLLCIENDAGEKA